MCGRGSWRHTGAGATGFALTRTIFASRLVSPPWRMPDISVARLGDPSPSLPIQQYQHSVHKGKFSSHELIEM
jgi:hypothetical protein